MVSGGWIREACLEEEAGGRSVRRQLGKFEAVNGDRVGFGSYLKGERTGGLRTL